MYSNYVLRRNHRFMGLSNVLERLLKLWDAVHWWFTERRVKHTRNKERGPPPEDFPLAGEKQKIEQLYSLMLPLTALNKKAQTEQASFLSILKFWSQKCR